ADTQTWHSEREHTALHLGDRKRIERSAGSSICRERCYQLQCQRACRLFLWPHFSRHYGNSLALLRQNSWYRLWHTSGKRVSDSDDSATDNGITHTYYRHTLGHSAPGAGLPCSKHTTELRAPATTVHVAIAGRCAYNETGYPFKRHKIALERFYMKAVQF